MRAEEANKKVCPFMIFGTEEVDGETQYYNRNCITFECMAWISTINVETKEYDSGYCARLKQ